jgi:hypothetical protein
LREIGANAVSGCSSLRSICLPASVEVLADYCMADLTQLSSFTFESGSRLREMKEGVFAGCILLKSIRLPASLSVSDGSGFHSSFIEEIEVDAANPYCSVSGEFLVALHDKKLLRHFGLSENVIIPREYEVIGGCCFQGKQRSLTLSFEDLPKLARFDDNAFCFCSPLGSLCIPASVKIIGSGCFYDCEHLAQVTFESDSQLTDIQPGAWERCPALRSICIPALVECIPQSCFAHCSALSKVSFEPGANLSLIGDWAFAFCHALTDFTIPGQLEILEPRSFVSAASLRRLAFEMPSRIRRLSLPGVCTDCLCIPDSVEVLWGYFETGGTILQFGRESRLMEIAFDPYKGGPPCLMYSTPGQRVFVRLSEGILRRFRFKLDDL